MDDRLTTFTATNGTVLHLRAVREVIISKRQQQVEDAFRATGAPIDPPTRTIVALGGKGDAEQIPLTEKTLTVREDPDQTARNEALWEAHEDALIKLSTLRQEERVKTMLALGTEVEGGVPPASKLEEQADGTTIEIGWKSVLDYAGVALPEHPLDQKAYYLLFYVLNDADLNILLSQIQMLSAGKAVTGDQIEAFQNAIQSKMGAAVNTLVETAKADAAEAIVDSTPEILRNENSKGMASAA